MSFKSIAFFVFCLSITFAYCDTNILGNPDCENGTEVWGGRSCEISAASSPVHSGSGSIKVTGRDSNWQGIRQSIFGKIHEGKTYQVSGWARLDNSPSDTIAISVEQQDEGGTRYINVASEKATDKEWVKISGEFTLQANGALSVLDVYFEGPAPGVNFYIDDANFYGPEVVVDDTIKAEPNGKAVIDVSERYQKIEGIGASGGFRARELVTQKDRDKLYELLFKDLTLDIFRIRNTYDINSTDFSDSIEIVKRAKEIIGPDLKIMISPWTPPARMKSNQKTIGGTLAKKDGKYVYDEFANWWYESLKAYSKAGVKADYITIQNEPDFEAAYDSCVFAATEDANTAGYDKATEAVWQKLNAEMGSDMPKMLDPETMGFANVEAFINEIDDLSHTYGYAHHLYGCTGCAEAPDRYIPKMERFRKFNSQHGNKPLFQTEFEDKPETWTGAMNTAILMHNSFVIEEVACYLYWDLFWNVGSGLISITAPDNYIINPAYYAFKHYSAFIDSGFQRVEASSDNSGLRISAYISPDGKKLTAVIINTTTDTDIELDLSLKDFYVSTGQVYRSGETEKCVKIGSYDGTSALKIPAYSVTTLALSSGG